MSDISGSFVIKPNRSAFASALETLGDPSRELAGFRFSNVTANDSIVMGDCQAGTITGDVDQLIDFLETLPCDLLYFSVWNSQVDQTVTHIRKGRKRLSRQNFWKELEQYSPTLSFYHALTHGNKKRLKEFEDYSALDPNQKIVGVTLLSLAVEAGDVGLVEKLMQVGGDPTMPVLEQGLSTLPSTPLHLVLKEDYSPVNAAMLACMLQASFDPNAVDRNGDTLLHHAACAPQYIEYLELLVARGAQIDRLNESLASPLFVSLGYCKDERVFEKLIELGADLRLCPENGGNALWFATGNPVAEAFVSAQGVTQSVIAPSYYDRTSDPLYKCKLAASKRDYEILAAGLQQLRDSKPRHLLDQLLHDLVCLGDLQAAKLAVVAGASPHYRMHGVLPAERAEEAGNTAISAWLAEVTESQRARESTAREQIPILFEQLVRLATDAPDPGDSERLHDYLGDDFFQGKGAKLRRGMLINHLDEKQKTLSRMDDLVFESDTEVSLRFLMTNCSCGSRLAYRFDEEFGWKITAMELGY